MKLSKLIFRSIVVRYLLAFLAMVYIRVVYFTTRWNHIGNYEGALDHLSSDKPVILAFWHGRLLMPICFRPGKTRFRVVISSHGDGKLISTVMRLFGVGTIEGSSRKGADGALKHTIKALSEESVTVVITPDGPRGPRMHLGGNIIKIAQRTDATIIPISYSVKRCKVIRSWDRFIFAYPFNRGFLGFGEPMQVSPDADSEAIKKAGIALEKTLNCLTRELDTLAGREPIEPA